MYEIVDVIKAKVIEMELEHKKLTSQLSTVDNRVDKYKKESEEARKRIFG